MQWSVPARGDIRRVVDRAHLYDRILNNNRIILDGHGAPITYWRNTAISPLGQIPKVTEGAIKCYCWSDTQAQPDKKHFVCQGTGWITNLYQKYGYKDILWTTPSILEKSTPELAITGDRGSAYTLSGTQTSGTLTTERIHFELFKEISYVLINDAVDSTQNRIEYSYSLDDTNWIPMTPEVHMSSLSNRVAYIDIPRESEYIRFKITLRKRTATSQPPKWNFLRLRYRQMLTLLDTDDRFIIDIPAFLASRNNPADAKVQWEYGVTKTLPYRWWSMPEATIEDGDIMMFLQGPFAGQKSVVKNLIKYTYGPHNQITHREYESAFIRDGDDLLGVVQYLT